MVVAPRRQQCLILRRPYLFREYHYGSTGHCVRQKEPAHAAVETVMMLFNKPRTDEYRSWIRHDIVQTLA